MPALLPATLSRAIHVSVVNLTGSKLTISKGDQEVNWQPHSLEVIVSLGKEWVLEIVCENKHQLYLVALRYG